MSLDEYKKKLEAWKARLNGKDEHSISRQIGAMLWFSAFYRSLNESRRYLPDHSEGGKLANSALHELLDNGYSISHAIAIRRLLDKSPTSGQKGVYSLYGLIRDVKDNVPLITRTNVITARGLPYDFEPVKYLARQNAISAAASKGKTAYGVVRDGWFEAEYWHKVMDKLCGVTAESRTPDDVPDASKLDSLLSELAKRGQNVHDWVDKYVAHAASPESRETLDPKHRTISLASLWIAERVVIRVANFVSFSFVSGHNVAGVPIPQFDQFVHLDQPFVQSSAFSAMHKAWDQHCEEINSCEKWFWDRPLSDTWAEGT
jgi:hypothetical protein